MKTERRRSSRFCAILALVGSRGYQRAWRRGVPKPPAEPKPPLRGPNPPFREPLRVPCEFAMLAFSRRPSEG